MGRVSSAVAAAGASLVLVVGMTACGGSDSNDESSSQYCKDVAAAKSTFLAWSNGALDQSSFEALPATLRKLGREAPASVSDDYERFATALDGLRATLNANKMTIQDLEHMSGDMSDPGMQAAMDAQAKYGQEISAADANIAGQVEDACKVSIQPGN